MEAFTDKYGVCHTVVEEGKSFFNVYNVEMFEGSIQYLENVRKQKRKQSDILYNEELRANPMTVEEAFRDEAKGSMFNLEKINDQISYNDNQDVEEKELIRGNFQWKDGVKDSMVEWHPNPKGRFLLGWIPEKAMQNKWETRTNLYGGRSKHPCNDDLGCLGVDSYDIDSTNDSKLDNTENGMEWTGGSKGAISGVTSFFTLKNVPSHSFFLEYVARPETAEIFFEDCLLACVFYSMPVLIENNKARLLYHFYNRGYRGFCLSRFDKPSNHLNHTEKMLGGIPSNSADVIQMHYTAIEAYVEKYVGYYSQGDDLVPVREENEIGNMPFNKTLRDWASFNVSNRTKSDITIASGYALLGVNRHTYKFQAETSTEIKFKIKTY